MSDPRVEKFGEVLARYCLALKKGQYVRLASTPEALELITEFYRQAVRAGANVETQIGLPGLAEIFYKEAKPDQLKWISPIARQRIRKIDATCHIAAPVNTRGLTGCDPKKMAITAKAGQPLNNLFMERSARGELNWVTTQWPTHSAAQDAEMSLAEYTEFVFEACHLNADDPIAAWKAISRSQQALTRRLNRAKEIRVVAADTDLTFSCAGRKWINCDGRLNFPDGEVFTGPVEKSVEGHVRFSFPAVRQGREVTDVFLEFSKGKVVRAEAAKGQDYLHAMIDMDPGASYLGEAAVGTNYNITQYTRNTLFDEKIGGTVHLALGASYPETGSANKSGLHWDMVCDLRTKGAIYADGALIQKNGRFCDKRFPQPPRRRRGS